jgi:hypothetical protein
LSRPGSTQIGDIAEIIGPVDFHDVQGPTLALGADLHQPQNPGHALPHVKEGRENALVARTPQNSRQSLPEVTRIANSINLDLQGTIVSLDGVYDCRRNRKAIFNRGMVPNINANPRGRKSTKRGRKPFFDEAIFQERFNTIERVFGWEDKFRRLLLRFERISQLHYAFKSLAYSMINLRHFC